MSTTTILILVAAAVAVAIYSLRVAVGLPTPAQRWRRLAALALTVVLAHGVCLFLQNILSILGVTLLDTVSWAELIPPAAVLGLVLFEISPRVASMANTSLGRVWKTKVDPSAEEADGGDDKDKIA